MASHGTSPIEEVSTELIKVSADANGVAVLQLNRPQKRNAFTQVMIDAIVKALLHLDGRSDVRVVVVTSSTDSAFSAGMDLQELVQISTTEAHQRQFLRDLIEALGRFSKPLIAAVVGFALGGGFEVALACDVIYAAEDARLGLPEITIGTIPGAGGTQRLARALGKHKAMEFILTGDTATGAEFERLGLVNKVFAKEQVVDQAMRLATRIAAKSGPVVAAAKQAVLAGVVVADTSRLTAEATHLEAGLSLERALYYSTFSTHDCNEGLTAFLEKRTPRFEHR